MSTILRIFFDSEFNDRAKSFAIDPISIAMVAEDESLPEYYAVNKSFDKNALSDWLKNHVIDKLPHEDTWQSVADIRAGIVAYLSDMHQRVNKPGTLELWAKNGATDAVVLAGFFGGLMPLRDAFAKAGLPRPVFRDIDELKRANDATVALPDEPHNAHDCLVDARHDRELFKAHARALPQSRKFLVER